MIQLNHFHVEQQEQKFDNRSNHMLSCKVGERIRDRKRERENVVIKNNHRVYNSHYDASS